MSSGEAPLISIRSTPNIDVLAGEAVETHRHEDQGNADRKRPPGGSEARDVDPSGTRDGTQRQDFLAHVGEFAVTRSGSYSSSSGRSSGPRNWTSCSSTTPYSVVCAAACLAHQRDRVRRSRVVGVLDEVRMPGRDLRAADAVTLQSTRLQHATGGELVVRVLEDAPVRALVRRLCGLPLGLQVGDDRLDLVDRSWLQPELHPRYHFAVTEVRVPITQAELTRRAPRGASRVDHERALEHSCEVRAVCPGVHPDAAAGRPGDRAGELEAAEAGRSRPVQTDGVRSAASSDEEVAVHVGARELAGQLQDEAVEPLVGDEEIRAEPDHSHGQVALGREAERFPELGDGLRACEGARRTARSDRREAR